MVVYFELFNIVINFLEENKSNDTGLEDEKTETKVEENKPVAELKNSIFTFFIKEKNSSKDSNKIKEFLSFKFNRETNKFEMDKNIEKDFSINKDENSTESNNESNELLELRVIDGENKEKRKDACGGVLYRSAGQGYAGRL